ncbi:hypothetical protein F0Q45_25815 [Mycobacterium simiae]|uniref:Uncharacterized protein n=1 Tax=Mycobacterium simiae TaxID=1784 RepID=A0A5B1B4D6_MYCSI|nr:hypothetical protein [Mycobacterium simiae]KAA1243206.1 hypothetical protein F0Q45_25815 [Mycobacterium simiae]
MEGNSPLSAPPGPSPAWPPYYPPAKPAQRWLPVAIIVAAIIIATAVISAVLLSRDTNTVAPTGPTPTAVGNPPAQAGTTATSSTCEAWPSTKAALNAIPALPAGWNWQTPNIDLYVANQNAAVSTALQLFEREIAAADPPQVVEAARAYVSERRQGMQKMSNHTYTQADGVPITAARAKLDQLCGVS